MLGVFFGEMARSKNCPRCSSIHPQKVSYFKRCPKKSNKILLQEFPRAIEQAEGSVQQLVKLGIQLFLGF